MAQPGSAGLSRASQVLADLRAALRRGIAERCGSYQSPAVHTRAWQDSAELSMAPLGVPCRGGSSLTLAG
eukprot:8141994-Pyramimonas_sp.AAC.1